MLDPIFVGSGLLYFDLYCSLPHDSPTTKSTQDERQIPSPASGLKGLS